MQKQILNIKIELSLFIEILKTTRVQNKLLILTKIMSV